MSVLFMLRVDMSSMNLQFIALHYSNSHVLPDGSGAPRKYVSSDVIYFRAIEPVLYRPFRL